MTESQKPAQDEEILKEIFDYPVRLRAGKRGCHYLLCLDSDCFDHETSCKMMADGRFG